MGKTLHHVSTKYTNVHVQNVFWKIWSMMCFLPSSLKITFKSSKHKKYLVIFWNLNISSHIEKLYHCTYPWVWWVVSVGRYGLGTDCVLIIWFRRSFCYVIFALDSALSYMAIATCCCHKLTISRFHAFYKNCFFIIDIYLDNIDLIDLSRKVSNKQFNSCTINFQALTL